MPVLTKIDTGDEVYDWQEWDNLQEVVDCLWINLQDVYSVAKDIYIERDDRELGDTYSFTL